MMKKVTALVLLAMGMTTVQLMGKEPIARITDGTITVVAGGTNVVKDTWLNTGEDSTVITATGTGRTGVGLVRSLMYTAPAGVKNASIAFYAYDSGIESSLYTVTGILAKGSARYNLTNDVYCGRLRVRITQDSYTNAACVWPVSVIVQ
jgi:hypothetical protein